MEARRAQREVDERQALGERLFLQLGDAAHYSEDKPLLLLQAPQPAHEAVELLLGLLADAARVDDHDARLLQIRLPPRNRPHWRSVPTFSMSCSFIWHPKFSI